MERGNVVLAVSSAKSSGVARLGHTGVRALATRDRAPPMQVCMQIVGADSIAVDREMCAKRSRNRTAQYHYVYPQNYESHTLTRVCRISDVHCTTIWPRNQPGRL